MRILLFLLILCSGISAQEKDKYKRLVDSLRKSGNSEKLIPYFLKELKSKPGNADVPRWLGNFYLEKGDNDIAEKYFLQAVAKDASCGRCYMKLAIISSIRRKYNEAKQQYETAITLRPTDADIYLNRARLHEFLNEKAAALADYNKAVRLAPGKAEYLVKRGLFNAKEGYAKIGIADITEAIEIQPTEYSHYFHRASIYYEQKMLQEAFKDISKAIELDSTKSELYTGRGAIYEVFKEYKNAIEDYTHAINLDPNAFFPYYNRSLSLYKLEDMDGSCADLERAHKLVLKSDSGNQMVGEIAYMLGNYCDSNVAAYYYQRGIAYYNTGQYEKGLKIYDAGAKKFPNNSMLLSFRGNTHFALLHYEKALEDYASSIKNKDNAIQDIRGNQKHTGLDGESPETFSLAFVASMQITIAECFFALGQYGQALDEINKGIEMAPVVKDFGKENYYNVRGNIWLALGEFEKALSDFDLSLRISPGFVRAYVGRALARLNITERTKMISTRINYSNGVQNFSAEWTIPVKNKGRKKDERLTLALNDCNKALDSDDKFPLAYYVRGHVKRMLGLGDYCIDFAKASQLGYQVEQAILSECR